MTQPIKTAADYAKILANDAQCIQCGCWTLGKREIQEIIEEAMQQAATAERQRVIEQVLAMINSCPDCSHPFAGTPKQMLYYAVQKLAQPQTKGKEDE